MSQQINLYNVELRRQREWLSLASVTIAAAAFAGVLVVIASVLRWQAQAVGAEAQALDGQIANATVRLASLSASPGADAAKKAIESLQRQATERREVLTLLRSGFVARTDGAGFADYLRGLARQTVNGLWLSGFSVAQGGAGMEIRGHLTDAAILPGYIQRLNAESRFHGTQFVSLNLSRPMPAAAGDSAMVLRPGVNSFVLTAVPPPEASKPSGGVK